MGPKSEKCVIMALNHGFVKKKFITRVNVIVSGEKIQQNTCSPNRISNAKITGVMQSKSRFSNFQLYADKLYTMGEENNILILLVSMPYMG